MFRRVDCRFSVRSACALLLVAGSLMVSGCSWGPSVWVSSVETLEVESLGIKNMRAQTHNGSIAVRAQPTTSTISIRVEKKAGGRSLEDAEACLSAIVIEGVEEGDEYRLTWKWGRTREKNWGAAVSFDIQLPDDLRVSALSHNGNINIHGLQNRAELETHNGRIGVRGHAGDLFAESHNGRIEMDGVVESLRLKTHNGRISANLSGSDIVRGEIETHNGGVEVETGQQASFKLQCRTHNGRIKLNVPVQVRETHKRKLVGQVGFGEGELTVETHNGSITLQ